MLYTKERDGLLSRGNFALLHGGNNDVFSIKTLHLADERNCIVIKLKKGKNHLMSIVMSFLNDSHAWPLRYSPPTTVEA